MAVPVTVTMVSERTEAKAPLPPPEPLPPESPPEPEPVAAEPPPVETPPIETPPADPPKPEEPVEVAALAPEPPKPEPLPPEPEPLPPEPEPLPPEPEPVAAPLPPSPPEPEPEPPASDPEAGAPAATPRRSNRRGPRRCPNLRNPRPSLRRCRRSRPRTRPTNWRHCARPRAGTTSTSSEARSRTRPRFPPRRPRKPCSPSRRSTGCSGSFPRCWQRIRPRALRAPCRRAPGRTRPGPARHLGQDGDGQGSRSYRAAQERARRARGHPFCEQLDVPQGKMALWKSLICGSIRTECNRQGGLRPCCSRFSALSCSPCLRGRVARNGTGDN